MSPLRTARSAAALLAFASLATPAAANDCDALHLELTKPVYKPDEFWHLDLLGTPGTLSVLLVDIAPGPVFVPDFGTFDLGLSPALIVAWLPPMPDTGELGITCHFPCGAPTVGIPFYMQALSFDVQTFAPCISNSAVLYVEPDADLCAGTDGCTPGYWKQSQHFDSWPIVYTPDTLFSDVFADAFPGMTLLEVLSQGGGGLNALGRHAVAALLSAGAADVDNGLKPAQVIALFNTAFTDPDADIEAEKNFLASKNEQDCPLN
jgi:hypothetical protein